VLQSHQAWYNEFFVQIGDVMSEKPEIFGEGVMKYVSVATAEAVNLREYLRYHGVACSPPEPFSTDRDSIQLGRTANLGAVQALLDAWK
jgi:hypothetical protein